MMKNKLNKITKKARVGIAALAGIMMMSMAAPLTASAQSISTANETATTNSSMDEAARVALCERRMSQYLSLSRIKKKIYFINDGYYHTTNMKLYGRKILAVGYNGNFILDDWEQLNTTTTLNGGGADQLTLEVSGKYVAFAFSYDITWGTDYPYSGVFWNDIYNTNWQYININLGGTVRMADIEIKVGNKTVVSETNCSAHREWKPEA